MIVRLIAFIIDDYWLKFYQNGGFHLRRIFRYIILFFIFIVSWPFIKSQIDQSQFGVYFEKFTSGVNNVQEHPKYDEAVNSFFDSIHELLVFFDQTIEQEPKDEQTKSKELKTPELKEPTSTSFSIYDIAIGDQKRVVESKIGKEKRSSSNEYGQKWYAYHQNYQHFMMVAYDENNRVVGLFTNQDLLTSKNGVSLGSSKVTVRKQLGQPLTKLEKGSTYYQFDEDKDYDVYYLDGSYVTIFYDKHEQNTVTSVQIISEKTEQSKIDFYAVESALLREGFEYQLFDLTNATRVKHGLSVLDWNDTVKETARKHSLDMAENHYFDHQNLQGQSPFDRMMEDDVVFTTAGENLAYGQFSSIFAHEGLMNSMGHRENILRSEYEFLGVGVAFNTDNQPYYTQNFYAN